MEPKVQLPMHIHDVEEVLICLSGEALVEIEGEKVEISKDTLCLVPSNAKHSISNVGENSLRILYAFPKDKVERIMVD